MNYLEYEEEQFFYDNKATSTGISGGMVAAEGLAGLMVSVIGLFFKALTRADLIGSFIIATGAYLLTYKLEWPGFVYIIGVVIIIAGSMILQHAFKVCRIAYAIVACIVIGALATVIVGYENTVEMYRNFGLGIIASGLWELASWKGIIKNF